MPAVAVIRRSLTTKEEKIMNRKLMRSLSMVLVLMFLMGGGIRLYSNAPCCGTGI